MCFSFSYTLTFGPPHILIKPPLTQTNFIRANRDSRFVPAIGTWMARWCVVLACLVLNSGSLAIASSSCCPFCASINLTFTDQMAAKDVVVSAKLIEAPELPEDPDADLPRATFEITKVLKGDEVLEKGMEFQALLVGRYPKGKEFLVMGIDPPEIAWTTPIKASPVLLKYLEDIQKLPESGADRLEFFQDYFEHEESSLAFDAYDEFAKAPYSDLIDLKDRMNRKQLLAWITDEDTSINRRRLYLTMLGVCGTAEDSDVLEKMISEGGDTNLRGMDALVACYLCIKGDAGVDLIEKKFLINDESDFATTMGAVSALRFHGTEVEIVSRKRIISAVRSLLDRPKMADLIISDLARWEDWDATDKLVKMFKESKKENRWLRVPIVAFLMASPEPRAKEHLAELKKLDPGSIERAELFGGGFDDDEDDDSDVEREGADVEPQSQSNLNIESPTSVSFVSAAPVESDQDPFAELDQEINDDRLKTKAGAMQTKLQSRHTSFKVPLGSGLASANSSVATLPAVAMPVEPADNAGTLDQSNVALADGEVTDLSASPNAASSAPVALAAETGSTPPPVAAATPVAAVPYLTLKIIVIPFVCSVVLFFLLWSVVNGSFQRLIF